MGNLTGRKALVTGASKGVGKGIALELARRGCTVAVNYNSDAAGAAATVAEIHAIGAEAIAVRANISVSAEIDQMFSALDNSFGAADILVNNAGVQTWKPLLELEESDWDRVLDTNLKGSFLCTQRFARRLAAIPAPQRPAGRIVNIGSGCNKAPFPNLVDYTASKGGLEMFTKVAAVELGRLGITVNCVAPGAVEIERTKLEAGDYAGTWAALTPVGRVGVPADIAAAVAFLASAEASFITGQTLWVDGGLFTRPNWPYPYA